jgi:hypothetical protein
MEKILIRYKGNESVRYNGKEFAVSIFKIPIGAILIALLDLFMLEKQ